MRPDDLPPAERYPHGVRARYVAGCRCADCRAANTAYERTRALARVRGDWNGLVDAGAARQHLRTLSRQGVGRRAVAAACDVSQSVLQGVSSGRRLQLRARTERRILEVTRAAVSDHALVPAKRTWTLIERLIRKEGFWKAELARRLGYKRPALQLQRGKIQARNALRVERFYRQAME